MQHHQVLHGGLPRGHPHHRQRDHPAEGTRRRPAPRPALQVFGRAPQGRRRARAQPGRSRPAAPERRRSLRPLARPGRCTSAACARRWSPGCLRARRAGDSCCGSRTSIGSARASGGSASRSPICSRSASIGTNRPSGSPSACRSMTTRSRASASPGTSTPASARAPRSARRPRRRTAICPRAPTPGPVAS